MPKRKEISRGSCDDLHWIVDIFGSPDILNSVLNDAPSVTKPFIILDVKNRVGRYTNGDEFTLPVSKRITKADVKTGNVPDGLYFDGSHWYSVKNKVANDSYSLNFQIKGTAHFCQTFAAIIYLNLHNTKYKLYPGQYAKNIYTALQFWVDIIKEPENSELTKFIINEIKVWNLEDSEQKFNSETVSLLTDNKPLTKITKQSLLKFMKYLQTYALENVYTGCIEG
jgi:hypothetical protein|tara:strand:+ start:626 stop:1300 length:675 start_codon:yes stop_codon:yes gene_type:complete